MRKVSNPPITRWRFSHSLQPEGGWKDFPPRAEEDECLLGIISELLGRLAPFCPRTSVPRLEVPGEAP